MGHGWVIPNADGSKARCGGPAICSVCRRELQQQAANQFEALPVEARLGDEPIDASLHAQMTGIAQALDEAFNGSNRPKKVGFVLMTFPYGNDDGRCNYVSNGADRKDIATLFREQARRFEGAPDPGVGHG